VLEPLQENRFTNPREARGSAKEEREAGDIYQKATKRGRGRETVARAPSRKTDTDLQQKLRAVAGPRKSSFLPPTGGGGSGGGLIV